MAEYRKLEIFRKFSATLSEEQIEFISKTPELFHPEYLATLYQLGRSTTMTGRLSQPATRTKVRAPLQKPRKVVNKFIGFRTYYSSLLRVLPQKQRSPILSAMWRADQHHNIWELLSTTFSEIRDACAESISFERFLNLATEIVPVIPVHEYFQEMGMSLVDNELMHDPSSVMGAPRTTSVSSEEIAMHCYERGLMKNLPKTQQPTSRAVIPFTVAAQPSLNSHVHEEDSDRYPVSNSPQQSADHVNTAYDLPAFTYDGNTSDSPAANSPDYSLHSATPMSTMSPTLIDHSIEMPSQQMANLDFDLFTVPFDNYSYDVDGYFLPSN